jgi:hypothetical protein
MVFRNEKTISKFVILCNKSGLAELRQVIHIKSLQLPVSRRIKEKCENSVPTLPSKNSECILLSENGAIS